MEDIIDITVSETTNLIEITSQPTDEIIDVNVVDNREDVTLNVTPTLVEININSLTTDFTINWGEILGTLSYQTDLQAALNAKTSGTGTTNYIPKFTAASVLGNSNIQDDGSLITLGSNTYVNGGGAFSPVISTTTGDAITINSNNATAGTGAYGSGLVFTNLGSGVGTLGRRAAIVPVQSLESSDRDRIGLSFFTHPSSLEADDMVESMRLSAEGSLGIGTTTLTGINFRVGKNITGSVSSYGIFQDGQVQSDVTADAYGFRNSLNTQAASFNLTNYWHFTARQTTIGAGSSVTSQQGFHADATLIGATNNYGFRGSIPSGTNRWNLFMGGTADNYLAGSLGIGSTSLTGYSLRVSKNITGAVTAYSIYNEPVVQSDVTTTAYYNRTSSKTLDATFTLNNLYHYTASQGTFGASSTVTNQIGFVVDNSLTGATNNYAFYSSLASGTNRWNIYMAGTANNYLAGNIGIGGLAAHVSSGPILTFTLTNGGSGYVDGTYNNVVFTASGSATYGQANFVVSGGVVTSATLAWGGIGYRVGDTLTTANTNLGGSGSGLVITVTSVDSSQLTVTSTTGGDISLFRNNISLATNDNLGTIKWLSNDSSLKASGIQAEIGAFAAGSSGGAYLSFYTSTGNGGALTEQVRIGNGGQVGIGATSLTGYNLRVSKSITGATTAYGIYQDSTIQSDVTTSAYYNRTSANTVASAFTLGTLAHYTASQGTFGAGSTVTNQYGFLVDNSFTGATNNYGFYGNVSSGTNRWNLYMQGSANNYIAGNLGIGSTSPSGKLEVNLVGGAAYFTRVAGDNGTTNPALQIGTSTSSPRLYAYGLGMEFYTAAVGGTGTIKMILTSSGELGIGTSTVNASALLQVDSTTKGVLFPRMTTTQKNAISSPATGLIVFDTTLAKLCVYTGTAWETITSL